jgi:hypothetical protein
MISLLFKARSLYEKLNRGSTKKSFKKVIQRVSIQSRAVRWRRSLGKESLIELTELAEKAGTIRSGYPGDAGSPERQYLAAFGQGPGDRIQGSEDRTRIRVSLYPTP